MSKRITAGDTLTVGDLDDDYIGAVIEVGPERGFTYRLKIGNAEWDGLRMALTAAEKGVREFSPERPVTVITPPPVAQPDEPTELGQLVRIEGDDEWWALVADPGAMCPIRDVDGEWVSWWTVLKFGGDRKIVVSDPPRWPDENPVVPERIEAGEWPDDDTHLRAWKWIERDGYPWWWDAQVGLWRSDYMTSGRRCPFSGPWTRGERVE